MVPRYRKTEEGGGNTRKVYSNVDSKLKIVLSTELSNLAKGNNLERVLIARISLVGDGKNQLTRKRKPQRTGIMGYDSDRRTHGAMIVMLRKTKLRNPKTGDWGY